ncbi:MAG: zf-HC2 domain-containing protein [Terriglobia bacterium]
MNPPGACVDKEQLFAYSGRMLDPREETRVKTHLSVCASCRDLLAGFEKLDSVLGEWKPVEPSPWFDARTRARVASDAAARPRIFLPGFGWKRWAGVAAAAVLVVVASVVALRPSHSARPGSAAPVEIAAKTSANPTSAMAAQTRPAEPSAEATAEVGPEEATVAQSQPASQEMDLYQNLKVLENYDMLANFDVLSELPQASGKTND